MWGHAGRKCSFEGSSKMFYNRGILKQGLKRINRNLPARNMKTSFESEGTEYAKDRGAEAWSAPGSVGASGDVEAVLGELLVSLQGQRSGGSAVLEAGSQTKKA